MSPANSLGTTNTAGESSTSRQMVKSQCVMPVDSRKPDVQPPESFENAEARAAVPDGRQKEGLAY